MADIADPVIVLGKGLLVEQGPAQQALTAPEHPHTKRLIAASRTGARRIRPPKPKPRWCCRSGGLSKTYRTSSGLMGRKREVHAVRDLGLTRRRGQTVGVVGESGSGKSSMGKVLMQLTDPDGGRILLDSIDILPMPEAEFRPLRPRIQMVFQDPYASVNSRQTVGASLAVGPVAQA